jgi:hypothetical protein
VRIYSGADLQWCGFTVVRISMDFVYSACAQYLCHKNCSKCGKEFSGEDAKGNLEKKHEKICQRPKKLHFCQYCAKQFKLNWLVIRHEKGCRDRPG